MDGAINVNEQIEDVVREIELLFKRLSEILGASPASAIFAAAAGRFPPDSPVRHLQVTPQGVTFPIRKEDNAVRAVADLHLLEERVLYEMELLVGRPMAEVFHKRIHAPA